MLLLEGQETADARADQHAGPLGVDVAGRGLGHRLGRGADRELGGRAITCNAVAPGFIETDMTAGLPDAVRAGMLGEIPLKRFGQGEDVAGAVAFLLSQDAAYVTGQTLVVDGGMVT